MTPKGPLLRLSKRFVCFMRQFRWFVCRGRCPHRPGRLRFLYRSMKIRLLDTLRARKGPLPFYFVKRGDDFSAFSCCSILGERIILSFSLLRERKYSKERGSLRGFRFPLRLPLKRPRQAPSGFSWIFSRCVFLRKKRFAQLLLFQK